jgi:hypothetical protein
MFPFLEGSPAFFVNIAKIILVFFVQRLEKFLGFFLKLLVLVFLHTAPVLYKILLLAGGYCKYIYFTA